MRNRPLLAACAGLLLAACATSPTGRPQLMMVSDAQMSQIALYTMFVIPGVAALFGLIAWWRRRS